MPFHVVYMNIKHYFVSYGNKKEETVKLPSVNFWSCS